jgi:curved DNA-binding protein CbpA
MNLDPYEVLGVSHNSSWDDIKKAYKSMLIKTHPDKMGSAKYFMMVHEAYSDLQSQFKGKAKESNAPSEKQTYKVENVMSPQKMKNFSADKFNKFFDKNRINLTDPYGTNGYREHMSDRLNYQEDISVAKYNKVYIPTKQIVKYEEPEYLQSSKLVESVYHLGVDNVEDYSGGGGTDIMKAYCNHVGDHIDTVKKFKNVKELNEYRSNQNLEISEEEIKQRQKLDAQMHKLEQLRLNTVKKNDSKINEKYVNLHRRLC